MEALHWFLTKLNNGLVDVGYNMSADCDVEDMTIEFENVKINKLVNDGDLEDLEMECYSHYERVVVAENQMDIAELRAA